MATTEDLKTTVCDAIDRVKDELYTISRDLWEHPEVGNEEVTTIGSNTDGPHIAVLCEYDALPEIGHACGHNLIAEVGLAAGIGIKAAFEANGKPLGKVTILGTPAEESSGGKIDMINAHVFDEVDVAMMAHPGHYNTPTYIALGVEKVVVKYHGKSSHASANPWDSLNALDAAVLAYQNISCLRQQLKPTSQVHGVIVNGGSRPNVIPDLTEMEFFLRSAQLPEMTRLREKVVACFEGAATATGCKCEIITDDRPFHGMLNNRLVSGLYLENANAIGIDFENHSQNDTGSTDMGNVSYVVPSIHPMFYVDKAIYHTREFTAVTGDPKTQEYTLAVAKALAMTAVDVYTNTDLLSKIKEEFRQTTF